MHGGHQARSGRPWGLAQRMLGGQQWIADVVTPPSVAVMTSTNDSKVVPTV